MGHAMGEFQADGTPSRMGSALWKLNDAMFRYGSVFSERLACRVLPSRKGTETLGCPCGLMMMFSV